MGCEALPIEYYESLDSEKRLFGTKPLHKKTPIGDFSNIAILCLRYYNPINGKWLSRDPIAEKGLGAAGVGILVGTVVEDLFTGGLGVWNDGPSFVTGGSMIKAAFSY
jgi:hypothetical protein